MGRARCLLGRAGFALLTALIAITINFVLFRALPGTAVSDLSRVPNASAATQQALRREFGLDKSKWEQFVAYLRELAHGNLGVSYDNDRPVAGNLATALGNTVPMVGLATITAIALGMLTGVVSAWRRGTGLDHVNVNVAIAFFAFPVQWFGLMLLTRFAGVLPTGLGLYGGSTLVVRSSMLDTLGEDYILTARAKGLSPWQVVRRHALPNAMPTATLIALSLGQIVAGAILSSIRATGWESSGSPGAGRPPPCSPSSGSCPRAPRWPDAWRSRARSCSSPATRLRGATAGGTSPPCFRGR